MFCVVETPAVICFTMHPNGVRSQTCGESPLRAGRPAPSLLGLPHKQSGRVRKAHSEFFFENPRKPGSWRGFAKYDRRLRLSRGVAPRLGLQTGEHLLAQLPRFVCQVCPVPKPRPPHASSLFASLCLPLRPFALKYRVSGVVMHPARNGAGWG